MFLQGGRLLGYHCHLTTKIKLGNVLVVNSAHCSDIKVVFPKGKKNFRDREDIGAPPFGPGVI